MKKNLAFLTIKFVMPMDYHWEIVTWQIYSATIALPQSHRGKEVDMVDSIKKRINLPVNQGGHTDCSALQRKVSEASFSFQGKSIKSQKFIICLFTRGWYLTSLPPPVKEACLDPGWAGTSMLAMRLVDQVLPLAQALIFHCLPENFFFKKFRNLLIWKNTLRELTYR